MLDNLSVSGIGYCSNLGGYKDSCAAAQADIMRLSKHDDITFAIDGEEDGEPLVVASIPEYLDGYQGYGRLIKLMQLAYRDLCLNLGSHVPHENTKIFLAMPDPLERNIESDHIDETLSKQDRLLAVIEKITEPLLSRTNPALKGCQLQSKFGDRLAFAGILDKAAKAIANKECERCLLFVADTYLHSDNLQAILYDNNLKTPENPVGFIPGEGGVAFLLSGNASDRSESISIELSVNLSSLKKDDAVKDKANKNSGLELFTLLNKCLKRNQNSLPVLVSDLNGVESRAMELGQIQLMLNKEHPDLVQHEPFIPALSHGEAGVVMAAYGFAYAYDQMARLGSSSSFAILLSEESGRRSVIYLSSSQREL